MRRDRPISKPQKQVNLLLVGRGNWYIDCSLLTSGFTTLCVPIIGSAKISATDMGKTIILLMKIECYNNNNVKRVLRHTLWLYPKSGCGKEKKVTIYIYIYV